jgi:hypothetical protein
MSEIPKQDYRAKSAGWCLGFSNLFSIMVSLCPLPLYLVMSLARIAADDQFSFVTPIMIKGNLKTGGSFAGWGVKTGRSRR